MRQAVAVATLLAACATAQGGDAGPSADAATYDHAGFVDVAPPTPSDAAAADAGAVDANTSDAEVPPVCSDGIVGGLEECDDGNGIETDGCRNNCQWARCGDSVVRTGVEECDDGNTLDGDACSSGCLLCAGGDARFTWTVNGHCYLRFDAPATWPAAAAACPGSAHLVTYEQATENEAVRASLLGGAANYWIGFTDGTAETVFTWVTNEPVAYTNWAAGEPNESPPGEDCAEQYPAGDWNDLDCGQTRGALCEDDGWVIRAFDNHAYRFVFRAVPWSTALSDCAMLGGHLATITNMAEQSFVAPLVHGNMWLGAGDAATEGAFTWVTGEPFAFDSFAPGEPVDGQLSPSKTGLDRGQRRLRGRDGVAGGGVVGSSSSRSKACLSRQDLASMSTLWQC
jgi:cysteine-rich repeat protein